MTAHYIANTVAYDPSKPRVFLGFEDRNRDLSGLLEFGTVVQMFPGRLRWQLATETVPNFIKAVAGFFEAHDFTDNDFIAALGDPIVIAVLTALAADQNAGRVQILKWDRIKCPSCLTFKPTNPSCYDHNIDGRYIPVKVELP